MTEPRVTCIVLNWNRWPTTLACLERVSEVQVQAMRVVVVDNGSVDGSVAQLRSARPDLELIETGSNLGYAGGMNAGLLRAMEEGAEFAWLLNNDTLPAPDSLDRLLRCAGDDPRLGALASKGVTISEGGEREYVTALRYEGRREVPVTCPPDGSDPSGHDCHSADTVTGGSLLLSLAAIREVGLMDERYFHYAEEKDLVERMSRAGWRAALACRSVVPHARGSSLNNRSPQAAYYYVRNQLRFRHKLWGEHPLSTIVRDPRTVRRHVSLRRLLRGDARGLIATSLAVADAVRGRGGARDLGESYRS